MSNALFRQLLVVRIPVTYPHQTADFIGLVGVGPVHSVDTEQKYIAGFGWYWDGVFQVILVVRQMRCASSAVIQFSKCAPESHSGENQPRNEFRHSHGWHHPEAPAVL